ncbi:P-loop containing nucleoside triphosphate hydrolase protein [Lentinus tigrinus ALCF2SS1-7]|uniref:RNA helicase n=1 Tax=Lentinus tigrinus ALCF2SS1-6 TaxID=1328759 RepID=A0A5C2RUL7_9APHY|nr:P-loop containing nucleoside triphosphate hydrolase protein [Lentinus tigrinus ALCF2SS1-6]RPD73894.1 P-loop containing nucleoside triphosphate hydrolase protein [Lentinus tigrinus ALCF2SS1-7]
MVKISALQGISNIFQKQGSHGTPRRRTPKREHSWVDVSDDDLEVRSAKKQAASSSKAMHNPNHGHGPRKKPRVSAPAHLPSKEPIQMQRQQLPIYAGKDAVIDVIRQNDVTVLIGETGSGKTTQVPQYLFEAGLAGSGMIAVTQPRRVAATSLASRVASEKQTSVGSLVGYSVRFDEASSSNTKIKYLTDGMIVRELLGDPLLSRYSVVIVDEAHERTLRTDLLIANLKTILQARNGPTRSGKDDRGKGKGKAQESSGKLNPLKVVIMSATLEAEKFSRFFGGAKVVYVKGRQHPVTIYHTATSQPDYVDAALRTFFQVHLDQGPGDVLIFLPGQEDIESLEKSIQLYANQLPKDSLGVMILPLYASLQPARQAKIFASTPSGMRKVILATNIAETSITIPGVKYVIDTGKCKEKRYVAKNTGTGFDTLLTRDITQSSAVQRAGRAGREGKGYCFRLYTEDAFKKMPRTAEPEIRRCTLTSSLLQLKCLGQDLEELDFMDKPDAESIVSALKTLFLLGALDHTKSLTPLGRQMAAFPLEPPLARALVASAELGCTSEILTILSVLSASSKLFVDTHDAREEAADARKKFRHASGDHMTVLNVVKAYEDVSQSESKKARTDWCRRMFVNERCLAEAANIRAQLRDVCEKTSMDWKVSAEGQGQDGEARVLRAMVAGLVQNTAFLQPDGSYKQVMGPSVVKIHPSSSLADKKVPAIIYDELVYTTQIYARGVSAVPRSFIAEVPVLKRRTS